MPAVVIKRDDVESGRVDVQALLAEATAMPASVEGELTILDFRGLKIVARYDLEHFDNSQAETTAVVALQGKLGFLEHAIATVHLAGSTENGEMKGNGSATILEKFNINVNVEYRYADKELTLSSTIKVGSADKVGRIVLKL